MTDRQNKEANKWTSKFYDNPPIKFVPKHERSTKQNLKVVPKNEIKQTADPILEVPITPGKTITIKRKRTDDPFDFFVLESESNSSTSKEEARPLKKTAINVGEEKEENAEIGNQNTSKKIFKLAYSISGDPNIGVTTNSSSSRRVFHLSMKRKKEGKTSESLQGHQNEILTNISQNLHESKERKKSKFSKSLKEARSSIILSKREYSTGNNSKASSSDYVTDVYTIPSNVDEKEILELLTSNSQSSEKENKEESSKYSFVHLESFDEGLVIDEDDINLVIQYDENGNYVTGILEKEYQEDSEDSNAEDYFANDYPDEESSSGRDSLSNGSVSDDLSDDDGLKKIVKRMSRVDFSSDSDEEEEFPMYEKLSYWDKSKTGYSNVVNDVELSE